MYYCIWIAWSGIFNYDIFIAMLCALFIFNPPSPSPFTKWSPSSSQMVFFLALCHTHTSKQTNEGDRSSIIFCHLQNLDLVKVREQVRRVSSFFPPWDLNSGRQAGMSSTCTHWAVLPGWSCFYATFFKAQFTNKHRILKNFGLNFSMIIESTDFSAD